MKKHTSGVELHLTETTISNKEHLQQLLLEKLGNDYLKIHIEELWFCRDYDGGSRVCLKTPEPIKYNGYWISGFWLSFEQNETEGRFGKGFFGVKSGCKKLLTLARYV